MAVTVEPRPAPPPVEVPRAPEPEPIVEARGVDKVYDTGKIKVESREIAFIGADSDRGRHVHVAASLFHDIAPANELGLRSVWVNRLGETAGPEPTREVADLSSLADVLDEVVPA